MKNYRVVGYIPAGVHRWKLVDMVVTVDKENPTQKDAIKEWLDTIENRGQHIKYAPYEIERVEAIDEHPEEQSDVDQT